MSFLERVTSRSVEVKSYTKPSLWKMIKELKSDPENYQLLAFFERNGLTVRIEPRNMTQS